jgi:hypothetical protein
VPREAGGRRRRQALHRDGLGPRLRAARSHGGPGRGLTTGPDMVYERPPARRAFAFQRHGKSMRGFRPFWGRSRDS